MRRSALAFVAAALVAAAAVTITALALAIAAAELVVAAPLVVVAIATLAFEALAFEALAALAAVVTIILAIVARRCAVGRRGRGCGRIGRCAGARRAEILMAARTAMMLALLALAAAFRGRDVEKTYWALVVGRPEAPEGRIDLALAKMGGPRGERARAVDDPAEGARAITDFRTLDAAKRRVAWLELRPVTGRTHQIRVHCAEGLGCPVLGDGKYGGAAAHMEGLPSKLHLHARALRLPHPEGGTLEVAAPLPPHMRESFAFFGFEAPRTPKPRHLKAGARR